MSWSFDKSSYNLLYSMPSNLLEPCTRQLRMNLLLLHRFVRISWLLHRRLRAAVVPESPDAAEDFPQAGLPFGPRVACRRDRRHRAPLPLALGCMLGPDPELAP